MDEKTKKELAAIRHKQNQRAAERKKEQGLQRVSLWVAKEVLDQVKNLRRIGIVVAEDGVDAPSCVVIKTLEGKTRICEKGKTYNQK